jgi:hypothetical protein
MLRRAPLIAPLALASACTFVLKPDTVVVEADEVIVAGGGDTAAPVEDTGGDGTTVEEEEEVVEEEEAADPVAVHSVFELYLSDSGAYIEDRCTGTLAEVVQPGEPFVAEVTCQVEAAMYALGFEIVEPEREVTTTLLANPTVTGWTARFTGTQLGTDLGVPLPPCTELEFDLSLAGTTLFASHTEEVTEEANVVLFGATAFEEVTGPCSITMGAE